MTPQQWEKLLAVIDGQVLDPQEGIASGPLVLIHAGPPVRVNR